MGKELTQADESALYHHYEMNYAPPNTESRRRLASPLTHHRTLAGPLPLDTKAHVYRSPGRSECSGSLRP